MSTFSGKLDEAMVYAREIHAGQIRKKTGMPRLAHLLVVAGTVMEHGGSEREVIAALLHDAVEDAGGEERLTDIRQRFGGEVAEIVEGCSARPAEAELSWRERKAAFVRQLAEGSSSVRLIALADKLHNARALLQRLRADGESTWDTYKGKREGTLWYYRAFVDALREGGPAGLVEELDETLRAIEAAGRPAPL